MPNWVTNRVVAKDFEVLKKSLLNELGEVDFNILIPHHEDLNITAGGIDYEHRLDFNPNESRLAFNRDVLNPYLDTMYNKRISQNGFVKKALKNLSDELRMKIAQAYDITRDDNEDDIAYKKEIDKWLDLIFRGYFNIQRYGYKNWYEANNVEWGTKWNASETYVFGNEICFQTAWSTPLGIWKALSKLTDITVAFADEDTGSNCGLVKFSNGEAISEFGRSDEAENLDEDERYLVDVGFALAIAGSDVEDYIDMYSDDEVEEDFNTDRARAEAIMKKSYTETKTVLVLNGFEM